MNALSVQRSNFTIITNALQWIKIIAKCLKGCETKEGLHFDYLYNVGELLIIMMKDLGLNGTPFSYEVSGLDRQQFSWVIELAWIFHCCIRSRSWLCRWYTEAILTSNEGKQNYWYGMDLRGRVTFASKLELEAPAADQADQSVIIRLLGKATVVTHLLYASYS